MLDYPNKLSSVIFIGNCNWDCPYCQNKPMFSLENKNFNDILFKLKERKSFINHIVLSGGECTFSKNFDYYIKRLYENGFKIGIHTNGENFDEIKNNINYIDFIGLDIKTSHQKYDCITNAITNTENIEKTIKLIIGKNIEYDIRTTLYPKYVHLEDLIYIAKYLKSLGVKKYYIQKYIPITSNETNYTDDDILYFQGELNKIIPTFSRGLI